jgi:hypothetical protein
MLKINQWTIDSINSLLELEKDIKSAELFVVGMKLVYKQLPNELKDTQGVHQLEQLFHVIAHTGYRLEHMRNEMNRDIQRQKEDAKIEDELLRKRLTEERARIKKK